MKRGDRVKVVSGSMSGLEVELRRQDVANKAWHAWLDYVNPAGARMAGSVYVFDFELERLRRKVRKNGTAA
jgi:hypothetical protein